MADQDNNNAFLYFAVGALIVAVAAVGFLYVADRPGEDGSNLTIIENTEPAGGDSAPEGTSSELNLNMDDEGFSATRSTTNNTATEPRDN